MLLPLSVTVVIIVAGSRGYRRPCTILEERGAELRAQGIGVRVWGTGLGGRGGAGLKGVQGLGLGASGSGL